jgi:hypothetical protein
MRNDAPVEVVLRKVTFDDDSFHELAFMIVVEGRKKSMMWSVSSQGTSFRPVVFFASSGEADEEFTRRNGTSMLEGKKMVSNQKFGEIKGFFGPRKTGYRVITPHKVETLRLDQNSESE